MSRTQRSSSRFAAKMKHATAQQECAAATQIQNLFRGFIARDYVRLRRELETLMATKIQSVWRANMGRRRVQVQLSVSVVSVSVMSESECECDE